MSSLFAARTPTGMRDMRALMLQHASELEQDGHVELAAAARKNTMDACKTPVRVPLAQRTDVDLNISESPSSGTKSLAKKTPVRALLERSGATIEVVKSQLRQLREPAAADDEMWSPGTRPMGQGIRCCSCGLNGMTGPPVGRAG